MARRKTLAKKSLTGTRRSAVNKRRKGALSVVLPWARRFGFIVAVLMLTIWVGTWLIVSGSAERIGNATHQSLITASADWGFRVKDILVEGRKNSDSQVLLALINIQKDDPIFAFNPYEAKDLIERISWIEHAHVERRLPDTLYIRLTEREPLALWKQGEEIKMLDQKGKVIAAADPQKFKGLVALYGQNADQHIPDLMNEITGHPAIAKRMVGASWIGDRRWDLILKGGIKVQMPEKALSANLQRLSAAQAESALLDKEILSVDLREADRINIRTKPGHVQSYKASYLKSGNAI